MPYGVLKVDTVTFTSSGVDKSVTLSGLVQNPTFSGTVTSTSTISGVTIQGGTLVSGATVTGSVGQFTSLTAGTVTLTSGVFASGTAAAPSVSIGTATNGLYSPGADQLAISTGGTGRVFVASDGKVGIGTSAPSQALDVVGLVRVGAPTGDAGIDIGSGATANRAAYIDLVGDTTYADYGMRIIRSNTGANTDSYILTRGTGALNIATQDAGPLIFQTASQECLRILSNGKVGIGTSSPVNGLHVYGAGQATANITDAGNKAAFIRVSDSGSVAGSGGGILFANIQGDNASSAGFAAIKGLLNNGSSNTTGDLVFSLRTSATDTALSEKLRITSDGKVGIGTSAPSTPLEVVSGNSIVKSRGSAGYGSFYAEGSTGSAAYYFFGVNGVETARFQSTAGNELTFCTGSAGVEKLRITSDGKVGIGTASPGYSLDIAPGSAGDALRVRGGSGGAAVFQFTDSTASAQWGTVVSTSSSIDVTHGSTVRFFTNSSERARIDSSGRLLVGTSTSIVEQYSGNAKFQVATGGSYAIGAFNYTNDINECVLTLGKSRSITTGNHTVVQNGDSLGSLRFEGSDGTGFISAAFITAQVDGTPGTNDMPGRIVLSTTADGASSPTEQWRINNAGTVIYNQPAPAAVDTTATLSVANLTAKIITSSTAAAVTMTLPLGTSMDTGFAGLYTNMAFEWYVINTGATNAVTVQANTGHTIVGSATVAASNSGKFLSRRTAANTWVTYRLSS